VNAEHERRDVDVISLFGVVIALFLSGALICAGVWGLMRFLVAKQHADEARRQAASQASAGAFPSPRLETESAIGFENLRTSEDALLNSYGWVDRSAGIVRLPIDRAMQLIVERGLPDVGAGETPLQMMQARPQQNTPVPANPP
jgi:hypothetical protein